jgi:hypothetical protein
MSMILRAYQAAGGTLADLGEDLLLRPAALKLCHIAERIAAVLGQAPAPGWMNPDTADERIATQLTHLPAIVADLEDLARRIL